ncbi:MAG: XdhC family protein [Planctomycetota bacterium]|jgi:xanthine dehydrogenase accessory factor
MNDRQIYRKAVHLLEAGQNIALATVISTTGSTPGKVAYKMLLWGKNAQILGTVGGGLVEAEIINKAGEMLPKTQKQLFTFNLDPSRGQEKGICGGTIEILIETFDSKSLPLFGELSADSLADAALISNLSPGKSPQKILLKNIGRPESFANLNFPPEVAESIKRLVTKEQAAKITSPDGTQIFVETIALEPMLFIFGAGHLACYISKYAKSVNFQITICDNRAEFANKNRFPDADNIVVQSFETAFDELAIDKNSYVVLVTREHKSDQLVLEKTLKTDAKYIGMIGSKKKTSTVLKNLKERNAPQQALSRVYSPIGISIGALTPEEIALSIVAELVKVRRLGHAPEPNHMTIASSTESHEQKP